MAKSSAKKIYAENTKILANVVKIHFAVLSVYAVYRMLYLWSSFSTWHMIAVGILNGIFGWLYRYLRDSAAASFDGVGQVVDAGTDLSAEGLVAYAFDVIYIGWFVLISTAFISDKFWWISISIPAFAMYKIFTKIKPLLSGFASGPTASDTNDKQKRQKVKYARR
ncbi:hypothetical protein DFS34DRAFT_36889 [Phlyctochytrium arcticum]|nr:hypothetical protein DFS34DRAFT_36889 [Phlyctochytrium arcticum]